MKKKILAAVMAATMVFSLVACGSSDAGSSAATGSAATDTARSSSRMALTTCFCPQQILPAGIPY